MTAPDLFLQGGAMILVVAVAALLVKLLFDGFDRRRSPRDDVRGQEHQVRARSGTGWRL